MNLQLEQNKKAAQRRMTLLFACFIVGAFGLYIALVRANMTVSSDVVYAGTLLFELTELSYLAVELLVFLVMYAFVLFSLFQYGISAMLGLCGVYAAATLARRAVLALIDQSLYSTIVRDFWGNVKFLLADIGLELLQLGVIALICALSVRAFDRTYGVIRNASKRLGCECLERQELVYPAKKNPIFGDAVKRAALGCAATVSIVRVVGRLIYDFMLGAPEDIVDALWMMLYYGMDVVIGVGGYFLILWVVGRLMKLTIQGK